MANVEGIITENIAATIAPGLTVYDTASNKVGTVEDVDTTTGWFTVSTSDFTDKKLYIPFNLITNIDPRDVFLSRGKAELQTDYANPPARSHVVVDEDGKTMATTSEPSGYDGTPVVVDTVRIDQVRTQITLGSHVLTSDMVDLGTIKEYDTVTGIMTVEKGLFTKHDTSVPVTVVDSVDQDSHDVYLVYSRADVQRLQHMGPVNAVDVNAEVKVDK